MTTDANPANTQGLETIENLVWFAPRSRLGSKVIAGAEAVWQRLGPTGGYPHRSAIDPVDFKPWLPYLSLIEIQAEPFRIRYRLVGTEAVRFAGQDYSGKWLDETGWPEPYLSLNGALYHRLHTTQAPVFGFSVAEWHERHDCLFEWALYPLLDDSGRIAHCLSIDDYSSIAPRTHMLRETLAD